MSALAAYFAARLGNFFRFVLAIFFSSFSLMDWAISLDAPFRLDFGLSPRFAASAAPAAICCFFDFAGMLDSDAAPYRRGDKQSAAIKSTTIL
jgi:hypothetical protein